MLRNLLRCRTNWNSYKIGLILSENKEKILLPKNQILIFFAGNFFPNFEKFFLSCKLEKVTEYKKKALGRETWSSGYGCHKVVGSNPCALNWIDIWTFFQIDLLLN